MAKQAVAGRARIDRRRFLTRTAAGGAVAGATWVLPSVLTLDAVGACGTCPQSTFNWEGFSAGSPGSPATVDGVTITVTGADLDGQGVAPNFVVQTGTFGAQSRWWQMRMNATNYTGTAPQMTATFQFTSGSSPVALTGLCFDLLEIDRAPGTTNGWRDVIWITDPAGNPIPFTFSLSAASPPAPSGSGTAASPWVAQSAGNIPDSSTDGNVRVFFTGAVSGFRVNYRNNPTDRGSIQRIGIANLSWCRIIP
jgi:hypothetical protein